MSKKVLFVLMPEGFKDIEFLTPYNALKEAGHSIDVAGLAPGEAHGADGTKFTPNVLLDDLSEEELITYDGLIIPGGPGSTTYLWNNKKLQKIIRYFHEHKKIVATICYASITVAQSGIIKNKHATVYPTEEAKKIFKQEEVIFVDQGTVTLEDEKIITCQGPTYARDFSKAILALLT